MKDGPSQERKLVVVLFADLTNSTGLARTRDPEELADVMDAFSNMVRREIEAEGGTIETFIGDAVMAVFGVPIAHDDDATRAFRAALRIRESLVDLNRRMHDLYALTLEVHSGINMGLVVAETRPRPGARMITGVAVNIAQRLEESAEPGQIRVSARAASAARGFQLREIGPLPLRSIDEPVFVYELLGEAPLEGGGWPIIRTPIVGRQRELTLLDSVFDRVSSDRRPHLATIYGDPGVGKSRLVAEFCSRASRHDRPPRVVRGRCLPSGESMTYAPLAEILKRDTEVLDSDPPRLALQKIGVRGRELLSSAHTPDPDRAVAALCLTMGLQPPGARTEELEPRRIHAEISAAWRSYFSALASAGPTVAVIEDVHWADTALLDLVDELADHVEGPLLFLATARPELADRRAGAGGTRWNASSLLLEPLSPDDVDRLIDLILEGQPLPPPVRAKIVERGGGNPFFVEEITRHIVDESGVATPGGADAGTAILVPESVDIPDTVQAVLAARMDLLEGLDKRALQSASVIGRVFWVGPLARLLAADPLDVEEALRHLEDRGLVLARLSSSIAGEREYLFKHILTRDVAYESVPRRDRAVAHAEVGAWIEGMAGDRWPEFVDLLASHYGQAYRSTREQPGADPQATERLRTAALRYALDASDAARGKLALDTAQRMAEGALEIAAAPDERARAFEALGEMYFLSSRGDLAWASLREAVDARAAGGSPDGRDEGLARLSAKALEVVTRGRGAMRARLSEAEAAPYLDIGLRHVGPEDGEEHARLLTVRSFWPYSFLDSVTSDEERLAAREAGEEAAAMALRLRRPDLASAALDGVAAFYLSRGRYGPMQEVVERRLALAPSLTDPMEVGDVYAVAAWSAFHLGRYAESAALADEGFRRTMPSALVMGLACLDYRAVARCRLGDWDAFFDDARLFRELLAERSERPPGFASDHIAAAAFLHEVRDERDEAAERLEVLDWLEGAEQRPSEGWAVWRALVLSRRGRFAEARDLLSRPDEGFQWARGYLLEALCDVVAEQGAWDDAPSVVEEARGHAEEAGLLALPRFADRLEGAAARAGGDLTNATDLLRSAADGFEALGAAWEAARTSVLLAETLRAAGDRAGAAETARRALGVLRPLRSMREVEAAERLA